MRIEGIEKILNPLILPTKSEVEAVVNSVGKENRNDLQEFLRNQGIYLILNKEFVKDVYQTFDEKAQALNDYSPIVEICAGRGDFSYHLNRLAEENDSPLMFKAVDNLTLESTGVKGNQMSHIVSIDATEAIRSYKPKLVLCSMGPYDKKLAEIFREPIIGVLDIGFGFVFSDIEYQTSTPFFEEVATNYEPLKELRELIVNHTRNGIYTVDFIFK